MWSVTEVVKNTDVPKSNLAWALMLLSRLSVCEPRQCSVFNFIQISTDGENDTKTMVRRENILSAFRAATPGRFKFIPKSVNGA